jgi:heptosyltransferase-3
MAEVIRWLIDKGAKVIITSSSERHEIEKVKGILSLVSSHQSLIDLAGKTTIKQLAAIASASSLFIGVDSAPMHIAAAVGTPVIAIFGAGEQSWKPWGKDHIVIFKEAVRRNGVDRKERIKRNLLQITPEDVIEKIKGFLFKNE